MDTNNSVVNKMQRKYWITKQAVFRKFGKKEDECIVASDSELDAKLELFNSIQQTTSTLLKIISRYQNNLSILAVEEDEMGTFMKEYGKLDKTRAGKMMIAVGTSVSYTGQQRFIMQTPLDRLFQKLETFHRRAITDTALNVKRMEKARIEYRAALNWLKDISQELDPDTYKHMEKFKKVQDQVKKSKDSFDRSKSVCVTKIDVLAASRSNMFSNLLVQYERALLEFTEKCATTFTVISNSFKGYQAYDFCVVKELSDLKPDSSIVQHMNDKDNDNGDDNDNLLDLDDDVQEAVDLDNNTETSANSSKTNVNDNSAANDGCGNFEDELLSLSMIGTSIGQQSQTQTNQDLLSDFLTDSVAKTTDGANFFLPSQLLMQNIKTNNVINMSFLEVEAQTTIKQDTETPSTSGLSAALQKNTSTTLSSSSKSQNKWYDLFAELDPLANPDLVNTKSNDQHRDC